MTVEQVVVDNKGMRKAIRKGIIAALLLAVLTVIEFFVAVEIEEPLMALMPFLALKGWIILNSFMHVRAVFSDGEHE